jgi:hypothetical protein
VVVKRILPFAATCPQSSIRVRLPLILVLVQRPIDQTKNENHENAKPPVKRIFSSATIPDPGIHAIADVQPKQLFPEIL